MATAALALALAVASGCTEVDERAYSIDTGDMSLEEGLKLYGLTLPDCPVQDLRYALVGMWGGHDLYLRFSAPAACMRAFLEANDLVDIGKADPANPFPNSHGKLADIGWTFHDGVTYRRYHPRVSQGRDVTVVVDGTTDPQVMSLHGFPF